MNVVFAGTPDFAVPALDALVAAGHGMAAVYTQPDRPAGRGRKLAASPVKQRAETLGLPVRQPATLRDAGEQAALAAMAPDVMVVVAYGLILPQAVLDIPRLGCINIHASLLPRWRGAAPIQRAVAAGDATTGVCLMQMAAGLDTGPVLVRADLPLDGRETAGELHDALARLGAERLPDCLADLDAGTLAGQAQDDSLATYAAKIDKAEAAVDWTQPAAAIDRLIRAFNPWPVTHTMLDGQPLRLWRAQPVTRTAARMVADAKPGQIVAADSAGLTVACGDGALTLTEVQFSGKRRMPAAEAARGRDLVGRVLGE